MDPYSGRTYAAPEIPYLPADVRARLVEISGPAESISRVSRAAAHYGAVTGPDKARRRAANKAARKARRNNR